MTIWLVAPLVGQLPLTGSVGKGLIPSPPITSLPPESSDAMLGLGFHGETPHHQAYLDTVEISPYWCVLLGFCLSLWCFDVGFLMCDWCLGVVNS